MADHEPPLQRLPIEAVDPIGDDVDRLVLPGADHLPAGGRERCVNRTIPRDVAGELRAPIGPVRAGHIAVRRAAMPEATVNEDREPRTGEHDVRPDDPMRRADGQVDPKAQPPAVQLSAKGKLWATVAAAVAPHPCAYLVARRLRIGKRGHCSSQAGRIRKRMSPASSIRLVCEPQE